LSSTISTGGSSGPKDTACSSAVQVHQGTDPTLGLALALALLIFGDAIYCNQATRTNCTADLEWGEED